MKAKTFVQAVTQSHHGRYLYMRARKNSRFERALRNLRKSDVETPDERDACRMRVAMRTGGARIAVELGIY